MDKRIKRTWNTYTHTQILLSHKEWNPAIYNMVGPWGYDAKWSKLDKKTNTIWFDLYVESKHKHMHIPMDKQNKNKLTDPRTDTSY